MLESILGVFASSGFSAIFGGLTGILQLWMKKRHEDKMMKNRIEEKKLDHAHDEQMLKIENEGIIQKANVEADAQMFVAQTEADAQVNVGELGALAAALKADKSAYADRSRLGKVGNFLFVMVDVLRGTIRPVITVYSMIILNYMLIKLMPNIDGMSVEQKYHLTMLIFNATIYISVKSVVYWFGDRGKEIVEMIKKRF